MTDIELNLNSLAELTTKALAKKQHPQGLVENREVANKGGTVAKNAKEDFENVTGINVVSNVNAKNLNASNNSKIDKDE
jgi:hypothetical protein